MDAASAPCDAHPVERFVKRGSRAAIASEACSLAWLTQAGGAAVVPLLATSSSSLQTLLLPTAPATAHAAERFGRALAATHAAGADWFGQGPPGLDPEQSVLADLPHPLVASQESATGWGAFYARARIEPYVRIAADAGALTRDARAILDKAMERIAAGEWDSPLPTLCEGPARLHGDLWGGNVLWTNGHPDHPGTTTGVLIDPAAHGGHPETDLAELALFGSPHLERTIAAYNEVSPLAPGWRERVSLHQLHMLAVHAAKFAGHYGEHLKRAAAPHT